MGFRIKNGRLYLGFVTKKQAPKPLRRTIKYVLKK
jgi:hypothetical protein